MNAKSKEAYDSYVEYLSIKGFKKETVKLYLKEAREYIEYVYNLEYTSTELAYIYLAKYREYSKATRNFHTVCLQSFLYYITKKVFIDMDFVKLNTIKIGRKFPKILEEKEFMNRLMLVRDIKNKSAPWISKRNYALIMLMYATGMRVSEALKFDMSYLYDNWILISNSKGLKDRYVPIAQSAVDALYDYKNTCPYSLEKSFFISYQKKLLSRISVYKILKQNMRLSPHDMRHHFATHMIINGSDVSVVSELLGHASLITTQIYTHIQNPQLLKTIKKCHPMAKGINYAG